MHDNTELADIPSTPEEMIIELMLELGSDGSLFPQSWYVYRKIGGLSMTPWEAAAGDSEKLWPVSIDDPRRVDRPIMVDLLFGRSGQAGFSDPRKAWGGHRRGGPAKTGGVQSVNRLWVDGSVNTLPIGETVEHKVEIKWMNWW